MSATATMYNNVSTSIHRTESCLFLELQRGSTCRTDINPCGFISHAGISVAAKYSIPVYRPSHGITSLSSRGSLHSWSSVPNCLTARPGCSQSSEQPISCKCSNIYVDIATMTTMEWRPSLDNIILLSSIALAYIAGIVTPGTTSSSLASNDPLRGLKLLPDMHGENFQNTHSDIWSEINSKLMRCMQKENETTVELSGQLSLQALANGPRLRLLQVVVEQLKKEICNLKQNKSSLEADWTNLSTQLLCELVLPVFRAWVWEEHLQILKDQSLSNDGLLEILLGSKTNSVESLSDEKHRLEWDSLFNLYSDSDEGKNIMLKKLRVTGKADFYADFLYFVCFDIPRPKSCCNLKTLKVHKKSVLEDLVILIADVASAMYINLISVGNPICESQWSKVIAPFISSTRMLEKFRNEVALSSWLKENFQSVTAMFEDRFDLWTLKSFTFKTDKSNGSKQKMRHKQEATTSEESEPSRLVIGQFRLPVRRAQELRALSGWRYYYSLYLEFSDICGPILRKIVTKLGEGISFLLVTLIGRSLGLIYQGIRQSVQWNSK